MKKTVIFLSVIFFTSILITPAYASLGFIKPDSRAYFFQPILESIKMFFIFSQEAKADYLLELTNRRTEEMNIAPSNKIAERYAEHFNQLEKIAEKTPEDNKDQTVEKIKETSLRQQAVLATVYAKVPDEAKDAILNAQENSSKNVANIIESVQGEEKTQEFEKKIEKIQRAEKAEKAGRVEKEDGPSTDPSLNTPKELKETNSLNNTNDVQELKPLNSSSENKNNKGDEVEEPMIQVPKI